MQVRSRSRNNYSNISKLRLRIIISLLLLCALQSLLQYTPKSQNHGGVENGSKFNLLYLPSLLLASLRTLSLNLGGGKCQWTAPDYTPNATKQIFKTLVAGFPGGSKRSVITQIEALTGVSAVDEWPRQAYKENQPFMKTNYPHHEGYWTWGDSMQQVILVLRNPRYALIEYHDVLYDIDYATNARDAYARSENLYLNRAPIGDFLEWRDERTAYEIAWYGWFIDYWMEGGIMRDIMTHKLTTQEHFIRQAQPGPYTEGGQAFQNMVGDAVVPPTIDIHCALDMAGGCLPVSIISVDRLLDPVKGYAENAVLAAAIEGKTGFNVIEEEARDCIWEEVVIRRKGSRTMRDRIGEETAYDFNFEMYGLMIQELSRLKSKYSAPEWDDVLVAQQLLELLDDYILDITSDIIQG